MRDDTIWGQGGSVQVEMRAHTRGPSSLSGAAFICPPPEDKAPLFLHTLLKEPFIFVLPQFLSTLFAPLNFIMEKVESILPSSLWHQLTRI